MFEIRLGRTHTYIGILQITSTPTGFTYLRIEFGNQTFTYIMVMVVVFLKEPRQTPLLRISEM